MTFLPVKFVSKSLFCMVILLNLMELDESIFQVDVLKLLENAGWNPSFYSNSSNIREATYHLYGAYLGSTQTKIHTNWINMMEDLEKETENKVQFCLLKYTHS